MSSNSNTTKQNPSARVKGGGLVDAAPAAAAAARVLPDPAAAPHGPGFKDQSHSVQPPAAAAPASSRPANNDYGPDFTDQVRTVQPAAAAQGSGKPNTAAAVKQGGEEEEDNSPVAPRDQHQHQEPQAVLGGNGQEPSFVRRRTAVEEHTE